MNALNIAAKVARRSGHPQHRLGAVVMRGGAVVSFAANSAPGKGHAEERALRPHMDLRGCHLYVVRLGGRQISRPCPECTAMIRRSGVARVTFRDLDGVVRTVGVAEL